MFRCHERSGKFACHKMSARAQALQGLERHHSIGYCLEIAINAGLSSILGFASKFAALSSFGLWRKQTKFEILTSSSDIFFAFKHLEIIGNSSLITINGRSATMHVPITPHGRANFSHPPQGPNCFCNEPTVLHVLNGR